MYTDSEAIHGKISLKVNNTITYKNPNELIEALLTFDNIMFLFMATGLTDNYTTSTTVHNRVLFSSLQIQQFNQ